MTDFYTASDVLLLLFLGWALGVLTGILALLAWQLGHRLGGGPPTTSPKG